MKIYIPHLHYTINVRKPDGSTRFVAWVRKDNKNQCTLFIKRPVKYKETPTLAHEIVHILQYIAEARSMDLTYEQEHAGYLMNYIMNRVLDFSYYGQD